jgi:hypothetical protein
MTGADGSAGAVIYDYSRFISPTTARAQKATTPATSHGAGSR